MSQDGPPRLSELTTLGLGGPARRVVEPRSEAELVEVVRELDAEGTPLLVVGGGSNLVVGDDGFDGVVVRLPATGVGHAVEGDGIRVRVSAGQPWDPLVAALVEGGHGGQVAALSGIPGLAGATPIQNVGAYGQDVAAVVASVHVLDRRHGWLDDLDASECRFGYRDSLFKHDPLWVVLGVTLRLASQDQPVRYAELARTLGVDLGATAPAADVRAAVLELRRRKGMVLDPADPDTRSAGSFFTNPVLTADDPRLAALPDGVPRYPAGDGQVKVSAAWLIENAGFAKGYGHGDARISTKHTLALTNRGTATTAQLLALAGEIVAGVRERFDVALTPEPVLVGCALPD